MLTAVLLVAAGALVTTWLGYPAAVAVAARLRPRPLRADPSFAPPVSVVLAARDDDETIRERVRDCLATAYRGPLEVVVALDGPDAAERAAGLRFDDGRVKAVPGDAEGGKAAALNAGVRAATGAVLVFADARQRFAADVIPLLAAALADRRFAAVSGRLELPGESARSPVGIYWRIERWLRRCEAVVDSAVGVTGAIYAYRRELWAPLPAGLILDDVYVPMRAVLRGHRVGFCDAARAFETRHVERGSEFRRKVRTLTGVLQLCAWLPAVLVPWRNRIWVQFVCHKLLRFLSPYLVLAAAVSGAALGARWAAAHPRAAGLAAGALALATIAVGLVARTNPLRRGQQAARWAVMLNGAIVLATVNAARRRWDVWGR